MRKTTPSLFFPCPGGNVGILIGRKPHLSWEAAEGRLQLLAFPCLKLFLPEFSGKRAQHHENTNTAEIAPRKLAHTFGNTVAY